MSESGRVGESKRASEGRRVGESGSASEGRCAGVGKRGGAVEQPGQKPGSRGGGDGDTRYTVGQLASMAGVSARTLRYYEDMGLLRPRRTASNYRTYDGRDARRLAQILAMWACGLSVATIRHVLEDPDANLHVSLVAHLRTLRAQGRSVDEAIRRTERAIAMIEGMEGMDERSAFDELKTRTLQEFEATYGKEARELYGEEAIDAANERLRALTQDEWDAKGLLEEAIKVQLRLAMASGDVRGDASRELVRMHERWIRMHWGEGSYSRQAHLGLAQTYLADPRFVAYYDGAAGEGATEFLVRALEANLT